MNKVISTKYFLILFIIILSSTLLAGCGLFDGTVIVSISGEEDALSETYNISVDGGDPESSTITGIDSIVISDLGMGTHIFKAINDSETYFGQIEDYVIPFWSTTITIPVDIVQ
ncbi:hypothetical protein ES705_06618 [subsurface metagenome]